MMKVSEGGADIKTGKGVFFNGKMAALRSISAAFVKSESAEGARFLDATSATGIRGIRYALESGIKDPVLIDMNEGAYLNTLDNVALNHVAADVRNVSLQEFANSCRERFDIIDIDPFGSPAPLIYDSLKISKDNAVLMVTATDTAVLCGAHRNACLKIYAAEPMHTELCKEAGTRILLGYILRNAAQFNFGIEPLLSISDMHYIRVFVRLRHGASHAVGSVKRTGFAGQCQSCRAFEYGYGISPVSSGCARCGSRMLLSGPMWLGNLYDKRSVEKTSRNIEKAGYEEAAGQMEGISKEIDTQFLYSVPRLTKALSRSSVSPGKIIVRLEEAGRRAALTQFCKDAIKTNACYPEVLDAVKA